MRPDTTPTNLVRANPKQVLLSNGGDGPVQPAVRPPRVKAVMLVPPVSERVLPLLVMLVAAICAGGIHIHC